MNDRIGDIRISNVIPVLVLLLFFSCTHKHQKEVKQSQHLNTINVDSIASKLTAPTVIVTQTEQQIAEYIRNIIQDKNGNFWYGTNGNGVAHYDGDSVSYYSNDEGFQGQQITGMAEDSEQNMWFATDQAVVKYSWIKDEKGQKQFENYSSLEYFGGERFWSICVDKKDIVWAGSSKGIYTFQNNRWTRFDLPYPDPILGEFITPATAWSIIEDTKGHMWFSTNGYGVYKYDGTSFMQISKKNGLTDDSVDVIIENDNGEMWFGTRWGGVSRYDGTSFMHYRQEDGKSIANNEVCALLEDNDGHVWMSSEGYGVYRYDGTVFKNYGNKEGLDVPAVQTIFQDKDDRIWAGGGGGLYRLEKERFINVTKEGPWD